MVDRGVFFKVFETNKCTQARRRVEQGRRVHFKVFETKCPSAQPKSEKRRGRAGRSNEERGGWYDGRRIGERDHRGVFIGVDGHAAG